MGAKDLEKAVTEHVDAEAEEFLEEGWDEARAVRELFSTHVVDRSEHDIVW